MTDHQPTQEGYSSPPQQPYSQPLQTNQQPYSQPPQTNQQPQQPPQQQQMYDPQQQQQQPMYAQPVQMGYPPQAYPPQPYGQPYPPQAYPPQPYGQPYPPQAYPVDPNHPVVVQAIPASTPLGQPGRLPLGRFSDSIFDCFGDCSTCCLAWFCSPYVYANNNMKLGSDTYNRALLMYLIPWLIVAVFFWIGYISFWIYLMLLFCKIFLAYLGGSFRKKLRTKYQIPGSDFEDFCCHYCCLGCVLSQESRHLDRDMGYLPYYSGY